jgi:hypothetical protein
MPSTTTPQPATAALAAASAAAIPQRTPAGHAALTRRTRELTPRQRTALFLVDGKRSIDVVVALALQAGAKSTDLADLLGLGLIAIPDHADDAPALIAAAESSLQQSSLLPSSQSLHGDSSWSQFDEDALLTPGDAPLAEARALLLRAVRDAAPLAGALTLRRLKRAASRAELEALLDEVEQRLRKPHRRVIAAQTLRHVRHLLTLPATTRAPVASR